MSASTEPLDVEVERATGGVSAGRTISIAPLLVGISGTDLVSYLTAPAISSLVALAACVVPARRATRVEPTVALRSS